MRSRLAQFGAIVLCTLFAASCGGKDEVRPQPPAATSTPLIHLTTTSNPSEPSAMAIAASPVPGQLTIGQIADRIGIAWAGVTSVRMVTTSWSESAATPVAASPVAVAPTSAKTDEFLAPGKRHIQQTANGALVFELIVIDGEIYARGPAIPGLATPVNDPAAWIALDVSSSRVAASYVSTYEHLLEPLAAPYAALSPAERDRTAWDMGSVEINGQTCHRYRVSDTTLTGERIDIFVSIGSNDLPCSIETHVSTSRTVTTFSYNVDLSINAPLP